MDLKQFVVVAILLVFLIGAASSADNLENRIGEDEFENLFEGGIGEPWVGGNPPWQQVNDASYGSDSMLAGQGQVSANMEHPSSGPTGSRSQPTSVPTASSTGALSFAQDQTLSQEAVQATGGMKSAGEKQVMAYAMVTGLQLWVYYNGAWTTGPAAVNYYGSTSMLTNNDQYQYLWSWEMYPNGQQYWRSLGYRMPGYVHSQFTGDEPGWHRLAIWGSSFGWSNLVWIYVYPSYQPPEYQPPSTQPPIYPPSGEVSASNQPPRITSFTVDATSPMQAGPRIRWTTETIDPDGDTLYFRYLVKGPQTNGQWQDYSAWIPDKYWSWMTSMFTPGQYQIQVQVRDKNHAGENSYDDARIADFTLT